MAFAFQLEDENLRRIFEYYNMSKDQAFLLLPLVGIIRYIVALKGNVEDQVNVFKDVLICCVLLATFASFINLGMELPQYISKWTHLGDVSVNVDPTAGDKFSLTVATICRWATHICYVIAKVIYYVSLLILCFLSAWVILGVTMTSFFGAFIVFLVVFLFVCLIPTFWTLVNLGTKLLFDSKDPDWNNSVLIMSAIGKAFLTWLSFKKALYEPFLQKFHEASKSIAQKGIQTAALAGSGLGLGAKAVGALGGQKYIDGTGNALSSLKSNALKASQQTIPTAENLIASASYGAMKGLSAASPKIAGALKNGANYFRNRSNPYNLQPIPGSSPFSRTLSGSSSFGTRSTSIGNASQLGSLAPIAGVGPSTSSTINSPRSGKIPSNMTNVLRSTKPVATASATPIHSGNFFTDGINPAATSLGTDFKTLPKLNQVSHLNPSAYSGVMNVSNINQAPKKYVVSDRVLQPMPSNKTTVAKK